MHSVRQLRTGSHAVGIGHEVLDKLADAKDGALSQAFVTSPIGGKVIRRTVSLGETVVSGGDPLFVVVDDSVVWADIAVYKEDSREGRSWPRCFRSGLTPVKRWQKVQLQRSFR